MRTQQTHVRPRASGSDVLPIGPLSPDTRMARAIRTSRSLSTTHTPPLPLVSFFIFIFFFFLIFLFVPPWTVIPMLTNLYEVAVIVDARWIMTPVPK